MVILPSSAFVQISAASFHSHQIQHSQAPNSSKTVRCHCNSKDCLSSGCYSKMDKILGKSQIQKPCNFVLSQNDTRQQIHYLTSIFSSHKITKIGIRDTTSTAYFCRSSFAATCETLSTQGKKQRNTKQHLLIKTFTGSCAHMRLETTPWLALSPCRGNLFKRTN